MNKDEPVKWYRLDNAAKLYPAIKSRKWTAVFRISMTLTETVDRAVLQQALTQATRRMGIFSCRLRAGAFWYYFEINKKEPVVMDDAVNPCIRLYRREKTGHLFRVRAFERRISLEVFHSVSDGYGALVFLKTLVAQYLRLKGYDIPCTHDVLDCAAPVSDAETEDGFLRYYNKKAVRAWKETRAWRIPGTHETGHTFNIVTGKCSVQQLKALGKQYSVSLTELLVAVYIYALYNIQIRENPKKLLPIKVSVPVNLRAFFETRTLRNFSSYVNPEINASWGEYTFEEVARIVHHHLRTEITAKTLASKMSKKRQGGKKPSRAAAAAVSQEHRDPHDIQHSGRKPYDEHAVQPRRAGSAGGDGGTCGALRCDSGRAALQQRQLRRMLLSGFAQYQLYEHPPRSRCGAGVLHAACKAGRPCENRK